MPDLSPALTEDMVAAASSVISAYTGGDPDSDKIAREALSAALGDRIVVELPEPDERARLLVPAPHLAEAEALSMLANAREARRLAVEGGVGDA